MQKRDIKEEITKQTGSTELSCISPWWDAPLTALHDTAAPVLSQEQPRHAQNLLLFHLSCSFSLPVSPDGLHQCTAFPPNPFPKHFSFCFSHLPGFVSFLLLPDQPTPFQTHSKPDQPTPFHHFPLRPQLHSTDRSHTASLSPACKALCQGWTYREAQRVGLMAPYHAQETLLD